MDSEVLDFRLVALRVIFGTVTSDSVVVQHGLTLAIAILDLSQIAIAIIGLKTLMTAVVQIGWPPVLVEGNAIGLIALCIILANDCAIPGIVVHGSPLGVQRC